MSSARQEVSRLVRKLCSHSEQACGPFSRLSAHSSHASGPSHSRRMAKAARPVVAGVLPRVTVLGTGGTIAGSAAGPGQTAGYNCGVLPVGKLIETVPELGRVAELRSEQMVNIGSPDVTAKDLVRMAQAIETELKGDTDGIVITHGTDTMEESAFFLELTVDSDKPVVLVGAMRPSNAYSADGPMNLLCAVNLAASASARKRGVMMVLNDRICSARFTSKTNANSLDAFKAEEQGYFDVTGHNAGDGLPQVDILYGHVDMNPKLFETAAETSRGVVLAGMGAGCWATKAGRKVAEVVKASNYPVVVSRRIASGFVGGDSYYGLGDCCIGGGLLDAKRCRIQLQLALARGYDRQAIRDLFERWRGAEEEGAGYP